MHHPLSLRAATINLLPYQRQLENIYEVDVPQNVDDFLISDAYLARCLGGENGWLDSGEQLLVHEDEDCLNISLYIDQAILDRLQADDPTENLHSGNLADFCIVVEGVSHFLYLLWNAHFDRPVSLLELEIQAEVDKYIAASCLFSQQSRGQVPPGLTRWLFSEPAFDSRLDDVARRRYQDANYYAGRFCAEIEDRYLRQKRPGSLIKELRRFYRLTRWQKIDRIESLPLGERVSSLRLN